MDAKFIAKQHTQDSERTAADDNHPKAPRGSAKFVAVEEPILAAIDLGTNNCRLIIAKAHIVAGKMQGYSVLDSFSRIVRLGAGLSRTGLLGEEEMARTLAALTICSNKIARLPVSNARYIATEACRSAQNGAAFIADVQRHTGLALDIIDRESEAKLAALGCAELADKKAQSALVFDIGGGSTELVWLHRRKAERTPPFVANAFDGGAIESSGFDVGDFEIGSWISLPLGVVSLAERFGGHEVSAQSYYAQVDEVSKSLAPFVVETGHLIHEPGFHLLGASGTVTTIAGVHLGLRRYERRYVDGLWMTQKQLAEAIKDIQALDYEARANHGCIGTQRADLVLAGCAIFEAIQKAFPSRFLRVADRGLREGILAQLLAEKLAMDFASTQAYQNSHVKPFDALSADVEPLTFLSGD